LAVLREKWSEALMRRRQYLDQQIQRLINKQGRSSWLNDQYMHIEKGRLPMA